MTTSRGDVWAHRRSARTAEITGRRMREHVKSLAIVPTIEPRKLGSMRSLFVRERNVYERPSGP